MAAFRTGDTLVWIIGPILDDSGNAVTGATWTTVIARKPDETSFTVTYKEFGSGMYKSTGPTASQRGTWFVFSQATVNGIVYQDMGEASVYHNFKWGNG